MLSEDQTLVRRAVRGDRSAAEALVQRHQDRIYSLALRTLGGDLEEARDAAQEAFLRAFANLDRFGGDCNFGAWLRTIVVNVCLDRLRRAGRMQTIDDPDRLARVADLDGPTPLKTGEAAERAALLHAALLKLPPQQRAVLALRYQEGLRYRQIAEILEMKEDLARYHALRGRRALKKILGKTLDEVNRNEV